MDLTARQKRMLEYIREHLQETGYPPTIREIGREVGISSTSVVNYNLNVLQQKGYIQRSRETSRGLRLVGGEGAPAVCAEYAVPVMGTIAAGEPLRLPETDFSITDYESITLTQDILPPAPDLFALRVKGNSMIDALVNDGDIVVLRLQSQAENGDMVAAWLIDEGETTLKRFYWEKDGNRVRLQPANPQMRPIYVHPANLEIKGKVVAVIRQLQ
ncbi:MAG TPA: transcriptional repressor LexA [Anaerolineae bacterium]|nr:transcriptional repressor LexA [Anaerolineae bacterium]HOQ99918.1 transcriptional repressor LexA [Anaerolineae bacterium]HPL29108.1 transcriptional repressor LexA [Anaerolineae bacterium]